MHVSRRQVAVYALVAFFVVGVGVAAAAHIAGTVSVSNGVSLQAPDGMNATLTGTTEANLENPFPTSGTVQWTTEAGNISFFSAGAAEATVDTSNITGTWTNVTDIDASSNTITIDPEDKDSIVVGGMIDHIAFKGSFGVDDGVVDFAYGGPSSTSRVTLQNVPADTQLFAVDASTGTILDEATSNPGGAVTFDSLTNSDHAVLLQVNAADSPVLSNASPTGALTSGAPSQLSIDVNDTEFPDGDTVEVNVSLDGTQLQSTTISSNQTVTTAIPTSGLTGGSHDWTVRAEDSFGAVEQKSYTYSMPAGIVVRNELDYNDTVTSPISVNGTFYTADDLIFERPSVTTGVINTTGLPVSEDYIVTVTPDDTAWTQRSFYLTTIFEQQSVYLLNTSAVTTIESRFVLNDPTGEFDTSSVLFIQRPVTIGEHVFVYNPIEAHGDGESTATIGAPRIGDDGADTPYESEVRVQPPIAGEISELTVNVGRISGSQYTANVDIYVNEGVPNESYGDGTLVRSNWNPTFSTGEQTISLDTNYTFEANANYTIEFVTKNSDGDSVGDFIQPSVDTDNTFVDSWTYQSSGSATTGPDPVDITFNLGTPENAGDTVWRTVHSDEFGAEGVTATLEQDVRYRIRIRNDAGTEQIVGPYRSTVGETVSVSPGAPGIDMGQYENGWAASADLTNQTLTYAYDDPQQETDQLTVYIHEKNNESNQLQPNETFFDLGSVSQKVTLTQNESEQTWVVNFVVERGGEEFVEKIEVSNRRDLFGDFPQPWRSGIGIGLLVLLGGAFSQRNAATGGVVVGVVGGILFFIGLLTGLTTGVGVTLGIFAAVLNQLRQSGGL